MMKKLFTGASAVLAGLLLASPAAAQGEAESMMVLGGYSNYTVSFSKHPEGQVAEQDGDIDIFNNTEIFFNGSAETDGGLQISARVELEGHSENDQIDEHYITISGGFGSVEVGANDGADERTAKGIFYNSSGVDYWYWNDITVPTGAGYRAVGIISDGMGVVYTTPSLGGATFAIGYKPSRESGSRRGVVQFGDENVLSFGAKYEADLDGITFAGSLGYGTYETTDADDVATDYSVWGIGVNLGFGDTTLYGRWQEDENDTTGDANKPGQEIGSLAISHVLGPVKLGLGWVQSTNTTYNDGHNTVDETTDVALATAGPDAAVVLQQENEDTMLIGSVDYSLGSGVTVSAYVAWGETEQVGAPHTISAAVEAAAAYNTVVVTVATADVAEVMEVMEVVGVEDDPETTADETVEPVEPVAFAPAITAGDTIVTVVESFPAVEAEDATVTEAGSAKDADNSASGSAFGVALNLAF